MQCPVCGENRFRVVLGRLKKYPVSEKVVYVYCDNCSNVYLVTDYEKNKGIYVNRQYQDLALNDLSEQQSFRASKIINFLGKYIPDIFDGRGRKILDIGSNTSAFLQAYKKRGWDVYGVEPNREISNYGKRKFNIAVSQEFYSAGLFSKNYFDFIFSLHVIEHSHKPFEFLQTANFHLKKNGLIHLETPNLLHTESSQIGWGHLSLFTPRMLCQLIQRAGFEIVELHKRKLFPEYTLSMGLVGKKIKEVASINTYVVVDRCFKKESFLLLKGILNFEFFCGLLKGDIFIKALNIKKTFSRGLKLLRQINEAKN